MTPQRREVLEVLQTSCDHPTAIEVFMRAKERMPGISLATVYNCLETLTEHHLIRQVNIERASSRYCANLQEHVHFHCEKCGLVIDAPPLLPVADARILIDRADAVAMVVASERTSRDAVTTVLRENPDLAGKAAGVVLNGVIDDFERYYGEPGRVFAEANTQVERQT